MYSRNISNSVSRNVQNLATGYIVYIETLKSAKHILDLQNSKFFIPSYLTQGEGILCVSFQVSDGLAQSPSRELSLLSITLVARERGPTTRWQSLILGRRFKCNESSHKYTLQFLKSSLD